MVSSKWIQVESPSPFRFFAALMPPWAQTECERLTGTMENRSTVPPASAILMTAARPASPPPTTMILGVAILALSEIREQRPENRDQRSENSVPIFATIVPESRFRADLCSLL